MEILDSECHLPEEVKENDRNYIKSLGFFLAKKSDVYYIVPCLDVKNENVAWYQEVSELLKEYDKKIKYVKNFIIKNIESGNEYLEELNKIKIVV